MSAPLSEQQLAEIAARAERVRAMKFVTGLNAASGHFDTPVERELYTLAATCWNALQAQLRGSDALLAEATRLRAQVDEMVHAAMGDRKVRLFDEVGEVRNARTIADAQLARANTLDRLCREKNEHVAALEAERHTTNEALDDAVTALREKDARIAALEESPLAWAEQLDFKSLDNLLISLSQAADYEPMSGVIGEIHEVLAGFRTAADARAEQEFVAETGERA